jgi:spore coat protein A, manganese oxidase
MKYSVIAGAAAALPLKFGVRSAHAFYQSPGIPLFATKLRGVGPGGIPVALPTRLPAPVTGVTWYNIHMKQFEDRGICPTLGPTNLWGYVPTTGLGGYTKPTHLGGIIVAQKGKPIQISFKNLLNGAAESQHIIPLDTTIPGANQAPNRTAVHFHGGLVPWISDGGPFDWFNFRGLHGTSFLNNQVLNPNAPHYSNSAEYYYPLNQSARFGWYHDHAVGITRLNAYAGLASGLLIRDDFEGNLRNQGLPNYIELGGNELPLVIQDKIFVGPNIKSADPTWFDINLQKVTRNPGSLWYAHVYEPNPGGRWDLGLGGLPLPNPSSIPEFFGDTMLVNGTTYPEVQVQARRYRFRLLDACNARFLNLQLYIADNSPEGITLDGSGNPTNTPFVNNATGGTSWLQIGTEGGLLANPALVPSNLPLIYTTGPLPDQKSLLVAPAERPDVIVDFKLAAGKTVILYNDAPAPFPSGDDRNDYFPNFNLGSGVDGVGNPANTNHPGVGPNSRVIMRFKVVGATGAPDLSLSIGTGTDLTGGIDPTLLPTWGWTNDTVLPFPKRFLTLNEYFDEYGRLIQILGNIDAPFGSPYNGTATYLDYPPPPGSPTSVGATEEHVTAGDTEVWEIYNTTGDVHPMHFHLVNVQLINRQAFSDFDVFSGPIIPPDDNELGWKETVPMYPGTVTRVIMKFDLAGTTIVNAKGKPVDLRFAGGGKLGSPPPSPRTGGNEFVWHCHILEHEEHDMMHALVVT